MATEKVRKGQRKDFSMLHSSEAEESANDPSLLQPHITKAVGWDQGRGLLPALHVWGVRRWLNGFITPHITYLH